MTSTLNSCSQGASFDRTTRPASIFGVCCSMRVILSIVALTEFLTQRLTGHRVLDQERVVICRLASWVFGEEG